ncbi:ABC transporter substrate-binding protein [Roseateles sp.]|uniref:ABC transporter substrate-binding protein n=1 Tax=Roseateles sp. TaxID=1971397 RepID=UPI0025D5097D|nr:ABC transporter substrate-binding protein [Roseateles sp.]MBV8036151.1 ABC transporter substrate-binding protein [Roseateles sp.]
MLRSRFLLLMLCALSATGGALAQSSADLVSAARREGRVVIYSVLSNKAAAPLVAGFKALYPGIEVDYDGEGGSNEVDERFRGEVAAGKPSADVMWSSAMDLQMKLVVDGYAAHYESPERGALAAGLNFEDRAWGTTREPVVFAYNRRLLPIDAVPRDHAALVRALRDPAGPLRDKVTAFDIEKSGVGFMFAAQDAAQNPAFDELLLALGAGGLKQSPGTGAMLADIHAGRSLLGYNIMGAYALSRSRKDLPDLAVVMPSDYTLVLSRVMLVSLHAPHPNAARLWADYLLSRHGQQIVADALELFSVRSDVSGEHSGAALDARLGANGRLISVDTRLADTLVPARHDALVQRWRTSLQRGAAQ